ncbi:hypothetical protein C8R45DRAFT_848919, partial [Mycena sanguinolenta]
GKMTQSGYNAGRRDARVFGPAKGYTVNLDAETMIDHDKDTIGASSIMWNLAIPVVLSEVITAITEAVGEIGLPRIATRNVAEGTGYRLTLAGKHYDFPLQDRAPCEVVLTQNYSSYAFLCHVLQG